MKTLAKIFLLALLVSSCMENKKISKRSGAVEESTSTTTESNVVVDEVDTTTDDSEEETNEVETPDNETVEEVTDAEVLYFEGMAYFNHQERRFEFLTDGGDVYVLKMAYTLANSAQKYVNSFANIERTAFSAEIEGKHITDDIYDFEIVDLKLYDVMTNPTLNPVLVAIDDYFYCGELRYQFDYNKGAASVLLDYKGRLHEIENASSELVALASNYSNVQICILSDRGTYTKPTISYRPYIYETGFYNYFTNNP